MTCMIFPTPQGTWGMLPPSTSRRKKAGVACRGVGEMFAVRWEQHAWAATQGGALLHEKACLNFEPHEPALMRAQDPQWGDKIDHPVDSGLIHVRCVG